MKNKTIPDWVLKYKQPGTQIVMIRDNYYLYKIRSKWDPEKKRAQKITERYIGKITKEGIIPPKHIRVRETYKHVSVKEYGASSFIFSISQDIIEKLKEVFPYDWKELFCLALFRLIERSPLKRTGFYYANSHISERIKNVRTSGKFLGRFLREIGMQRELMKDFMRSFILDTEYGIIDLTNVFSYSKGMINAMLGHNTENLWIPQINLILIYSLDRLQPVYFRQVPGSIRDVSSVIKTVNEIQAEKLVLIGDKGLHSDENVRKLREYEIDYVFALRRNSEYIDYTPIIDNKRKFDGNLVFQRRNVWFYTRKLKDERIITYLDPSLKAKEENDLALRIKSIEEKDSLDERDRKQLLKYRERLYTTFYRNGTLSVRTNMHGSPEEIYHIMKSRVDVEQVFDVFKNILNADKSYMHDDKQIEGWFFVNFISMQMYYKIYAILLSKGLLNNYSPLDVITYLKSVYILKTKDGWQISEIPKKSRSLIERLEIPIT